MRNVLLPRLTRPAITIGAAAVLGIGLVGALAAGQAFASPSHQQCSPTVSKAPFGQTVEPYTGKLTQTYRYTLTNCRGMQIHLLSYGAITQSIEVPGRNGQEADVILGFKTLNDSVTEASPPVTVNGGPYFGETIGRYGNRIAHGRFHLNGHLYTLPVNHGPNTLHGGLVGFGNHVWAATEVSSPGTVGVRLKLVSPNGDDGANVGCSC